MPALVASIYFYGINSIRIVTLAVAFSVSFDFISNWIVPTKDHPDNWSSVTFAVLLSLLLPYSSPWWLIMVGCFIMIIVGKKLFGGLGAYSVHPVLLSFAMMLVSWPKYFDYTGALVTRDLGVKMIEPFRLLKTIGVNAETLFDKTDLFLGMQVAGIGNALVVYLLAGGILLLLFRQIRWHIPVSFLVGVYLSALVLHVLSPEQFASPLFFLLTGSTVFAAFFLVPESTTSPVNPLPMILYGLLGGILLVIIRSFSMYSDGVVFAVLLLNLCNPLLDRITPAIEIKGITTCVKL